MNLTEAQKSVIDEVILEMMNADNYPNNIDATELSEKLESVVSCNEDTLAYFGQRALELGKEHNNPMGTLLSA